MFRDISESRRLAALASSELDNSNVCTAILLAAAADDLKETNESTEILSRIFKFDSRIEIYLNEHKSQICSIAFNNDSSLMASISDDGLIYVWCTDTWQVKDRLATGVTNRNQALAFSNSSDLLCAATEDGQGFVWKPQDQTNTDFRLVDKTRNRASEKRDPRNGKLAIEFSNDKLVVAFLGLRQIVHWSSKNAKFITVPIQWPDAATFTRPAATTSQATMKNGVLFAGLSANSGEAPIPVGVVASWNAETGKMLSALPTRTIEPRAIGVNDRADIVFADSFNDRNFKGFSIFTVEPSGGIEEPKVDANVKLSGADDAVAICFAGNQRVFSAHANNDIQMWEIGKDTVKSRFAPFRGIRKPSCIAASQQLGVMAASNKFGEICLLSLIHI